MEIDRRTAIVLVVTVVGIVGLVLAAGTLTDPATSEGTSGVGGLDGERIGFPSESGESSNTGRSLGDPPAAIVLAIAVLATLVLVYATLDDPDNSMRAAVLVTVGIISAILVAAATFRGWVGQRPAPNQSLNLSMLRGSLPGAPGPPSGTETTTSLPVELWAIVGGVGVVAVLVIVVLSSDDSPDDPQTERTRQSDADTAVAAVREAAGRAHDRLASGAALDNAVYRAWAEMVDALDVGDPETTTPQEFATHAIEAGMDRSAVEDLTLLFDEVRYGDRPVTDERERRARETLTAIAVEDDR
ncbi:DUF4129 domain-containing protein [Halococcoides cellulosivorans]|nr:DUF4129 domain-containing protein [Halococcoides cellulosivorans]